MLEALEKIKAELMILGFISLLLTFGQNYIANICISTSLANTMLPCPLPSETHESHNGNGHNGKGHNEESEHHRRLLWNEHRFLSADSSAKGCKTVCFFRQFLRSVRKADYLAMRHGFISVHLAPGSKFDFQKYIKRSLEDDFKVVVGIRMAVHVLVIRYASSFGTKLQAIITQMAVEIQERHAVVQGMPLVQVSDRHFWFGWPQLILYLIHLTLFQYEFGLKSCFHQNFRLIIVRVALGVGVQILCSYITLPLYALVTQMGSNMKKSIFDDQTSKALMNWHKNAMKKKNEGKAGAGATATRTLGGSPGDSPDNSPGGNARVHLPQNNEEGLELAADGLKYYDVVEGKGPVAEKGSTVQVHFDCLYGKITAVSSRESKLLAGNRIIAQPYEFKVGAPPGKERKRDFADNPNGLFSAQAAPKPPPAMYSITEGMKLGGKRTVIVPPEVGYGQKGMGEIPPGATFELNLELLEVKPPEGK
ncbi:hypothetical protein RHGRI_022216 [Rhododendron griersonianum]|uniref:MLO-like protein n=1 Tax=Rhododendron griersonianum TaxID=479676 RepID=A0AAV6JST4_9ERIC|nr:hypothetical protein RHGRI_022216 [Rhododendron griersonianum]